MAPVRPGIGSLTAFLAIAEGPRASKREARQERLVKAARKGRRRRANLCSVSRFRLLGTLGCRCSMRFPGRNAIFGFWVLRRVVRAVEPLDALNRTLGILSLGALGRQCITSEAGDIGTTHQGPFRLQFSSLLLSECYEYAPLPFQSSRPCGQQSTSSLDHSVATCSTPDVYQCTCRLVAITVKTTLQRRCPREQITGSQAFCPAASTWPRAMILVPPPRSSHPPSRRPSELRPEHHAQNTGMAGGVRCG
jgi:hypothetical protein